MSLIITQMGLAAGVILTEHYAAFILVVILSTIISPIILEYTSRKAYPELNMATNTDKNTEAYPEGNTVTAN
jgi:Kef-type K+ transport system membrane component KefB